MKRFAEHEHGFYVSPEFGAQKKMSKGFVVVRGERDGKEEV